MSAAPGWFDEPARLVRPFLPQIQVGADADRPELSRALLAVLDRMVPLLPTPAAVVEVRSCGVRMTAVCAQAGGSR